MQALSSGRLGRYQSTKTHSSRYNACRCPTRCPAPIFRRVAASSALEDESLTLADLKAQLEDAVEREDYDLAARIRDTLQHKQSDARLAVEDANRRFYEAFASGRIEAMAAVWGRGDHVQTIHPGAGVISGRDDVIESWRAVLKGVRPRAFRITAEDVRVYASDAHGYVTCTEVVEADDARGRTAATNIFEKQGGKWVMTHHHGSPLMMGRR